MICRHCGKELGDGSKFCNYCGKRLGKSFCPKCGSEIPEDGLFCGECGTSLKNTAAAKEAAATDAVFAKALDWKKIIIYISWGCIAFAALMGLIFTFCIGASAEVAGIGKTETLYHYFGKVYSECGQKYDEYRTYFYQTMPATEKIPFIKEVVVYLPAIFGTVLSAGALLSTVVFAVMTAVACVNRFVHKKEADFEKPAAGMYISFALFATAFLAYNAYSMEYSGVGTGVTFSGATSAGLVLGGIGLGGYFVCKTVLRIAEFRSGETVVKSSIMLGAGVVAIIIASLSARHIVSITSFEESGAVGCGYMGLIQLLFGGNTNDVAVVCCSTIGFVVQFLLIVFTVTTVLSAARFISCGNGGKIVPFSVVQTVLSAVNLAITVTAGKLYVGGNDSLADCSLGFGAPIAVLVLSVIVLVGTIVAENLFKAKVQPKESVEDIQ